MGEFAISGAQAVGVAFVVSVLRHPADDRIVLRRAGDGAVLVDVIEGRFVRETWGVSPSGFAEQILLNDVFDR